MKDALLQEQLTFLLQNKDEEGLLNFIEALDPSKFNVFDSSPIIQCAYHGMSQAAKKFGSVKKDLDLFEAAILGDIQKIRTWAEKGYDLNAIAEDGHTALGLACYFSQSEAVKWLITLGADIHQHSQNAMGVYPLNAAVASGNEVITQFLLMKDAEPNVQQSNGATPLHAAVFANNRVMTDLLLKHNASISIAMQDGKTPLDLALEMNHADILKLLKEKGSIY
jgi:ankyrin repeat protein